MKSQMMGRGNVSMITSKIISFKVTQIFLFVAIYYLDMPSHIRIYEFCCIDILKMHHDSNREGSILSFINQVMNSLACSRLSVGSHASQTCNFVVSPVLNFYVDLD